KRPGRRGRRERDPRPGPDAGHRAGQALRRHHRARGRGRPAAVGHGRQRGAPGAAADPHRSRGRSDRRHPGAADQGLPRRMSTAMSIRHYLQFKDLSADEYAHLFQRAAFIKRKFKAVEKYQPFADPDRTMALIFEKASTRTRVSFEAGMYQMGGSVVHLTTGDSQLGRAEPIEDSARVISRM